ncbi:MAG: VOC family protein [Actinobacteria bacterium]|nr:VOC family protein [Actinomycetota bacterium]
MNIIVWADIPVVDLDRASKFYAHVLGMPVNRMPGVQDVAIPGSPPVEGEPMPETPPVAFDLYVGGKPSLDGATVYLPAMGDFPGILARVREAGGEVLQEPQDMGPMIGTIAFIKDTEGNRIGLHQPPTAM